MIIMLMISSFAVIPIETFAENTDVPLNLKVFQNNDAGVLLVYDTQQQYFHKRQ